MTAGPSSSDGHSVDREINTYDIYVFADRGSALQAVTRATPAVARQAGAKREPDSVTVLGRTIFVYIPGTQLSSTGIPLDSSILEPIRKCVQQAGYG
jgi:hypothetical protein